MMGYYEILSVIERLERDKIEVTPQTISNNVGECNERAVRRVLASMIKDGTLRRVVIYQGTGKKTIYYLSKNKLTEGFINDFFKVVASLIR